LLRVQPWHLWSHPIIEKEENVTKNEQKALQRMVVLEVLVVAAADH